MSYEVSKYRVEILDPNADIQPGFAFKSARFTDNPDDIPLVKGENVHQGYIDWIRAKRWPAEEYDSFVKYHLTVGDIVLAMDRPWVSAGLKWSLIKPHDPESLLVQRVARIRAKNRLDQDYLRHLISSDYFASYLQPIVTGVNVPHISARQIGAFRIPTPARAIQRIIAAILTAYDDLIEINKRRIALLEKMAEELYREWFVRMRFPGHESTKFVKGVPDGWEIRELRECAQINPSSLGRSDRPDVIHYVDIGSVTTNQIGEIRTMLLSEAPGRAKRRVVHGDIIWSSVRPANRAYCLICEPLFKLKHTLTEQALKLAQTRDLLLPRLISGKLAVEDLDIQFPPSMREHDSGLGDPTDP